MRVLVVEDHAKLAQTVAAALRREGMAVDIAVDGRQALDHACSTDYDVIDARLLQRLAANLIDNAICHNIPHGRIDIQVTASGGPQRLKITNTGPVIPASQATQLLQPFRRRSAGRPADSEGLGLGLSIVTAIAKAHHGSLTINPGPRGGLDIDISFPAAAAIPPARNGLLSRMNGSSTVIGTNPAASRVP